jgi:FtsH-binding integral membrane protein
MLFIFSWIFIVIYSLAIFYGLKNLKNISEFCIYENILFIDENKLI